jgi:hypothetical protein
MKKSLTALAAPHLSPLCATVDASLAARVDRAWKLRAQGFDIQDAQNPGHLDLSANYKFAEGWTADARVGFTARPSWAMEGTGLALTPKTGSVRASTRPRDAGATHSLALMN